jgi:mannosyltransferase
MNAQRLPAPATAAGRPSLAVTRLAHWLSGTYAGRVTAVSVAGLAGRLALIGYQPLWRDEAFTALTTSRPLGSMLGVVRADSAPPLAYVLERGIVAVWPGTAGLRLLPAVAGAAAIPIGAALGRRVAGDRGGVFTALVCAVTPALVLSAVDARMYAVVTTLVMAATLTLWRAVERPTWQRWTVYGAVTATALYTDYFALLAIPAQVIAVAFILHAGWRRTALTAGVAAAACASLLPWLAVAAAQFGHAGEPFWVPPIDFTSVSGAFVQFFGGPPIEPWIPWKPVMVVFQGFAVRAGILMIFALVARRLALTYEGRRAALFCAVCGIGAALLLFPLSIWHPLVDGRYAGVVWGPAYAVLGGGLAVAPLRRALTVGLAVVLSSTLVSALLPTRPDIASAVAALRAQAGPNDLVDAYPSEYLLLLAEAPPQLLSRTAVVQPSVQWYWGTAVYPPGAILHSLPERVTAAGGAVHVVMQPNESPPAFSNGYTARGKRCWTGVCVVTYRRG